MWIRPDTTFRTLTSNDLSSKKDCQFYKKKNETRRLEPDANSIERIRNNQNHVSVKVRFLFNIVYHPTLAEELISLFLTSLLI